MGVLNRLKQDGTGIVFISHKLNEVLRVADRITRVAPRQEDRHRPWRAQPSRACRTAVGRDVLLLVEKQAAKPEDPILAVEEPRSATTAT